MLIKKKTTSTILTIVIVLLISGISLAAGFFLKSQILEQSVEAASINQPQAETQEEIIETRLESETSESQADTAVQTINGVEIRFEGASQEDGKVAVNVCFDLPDDSDWTLWNSTLELDGKTYRWSEMAPTEIRKPPVSGTQELWTFKPEGGVQIETVKVDLAIAVRPSISGMFPNPLYPLPIPSTSKRWKPRQEKQTIVRTLICKKFRRRWTPARPASPLSVSKGKIPEAWKS